MPAVVIIGGLGMLGYMAYKWYDANKKKGI